MKNMSATYLPLVCMALMRAMTIPASETQKIKTVNLLFPREITGRVPLSDKSVAAVNLSCRFAVNHMLATASSREIANPKITVQKLTDIHPNKNVKTQIIHGLKGENACGLNISVMADAAAAVEAITRLKKDIRRQNKRTR